MALAAQNAALHASVNVFRGGKIQQFGVNFKVRILVDNETIRPFRKISGKVVIETRFPINHKGIVIQFEGMCSLRYAHKLDNRTTLNQARKLIMENTKYAPGYRESPIQQVILPPYSQYSILPGSITFPFTLEIPGDPHLPAPFKNTFGNLVYRVAVYMQSPVFVFVDIGEKVMRFSGHHNLADNMKALKPISIEQYYKKSVFSRKRLVEVTFSMESSGYLPEERIKFVLFVRNLKCIPLQMSVQLVQQLKYDASKTNQSKRTFTIVASSERDVFEPEPELTWIESLAVPEELEPSFTRHHMYNVTYSVQFKVKVLEKGTIKGEAPMYIGTTREPVQLLMLSANTLDVPFQVLGRRASASSDHSTRSRGSAASIYSLPPNYSQLSSLMSSMETLPPSYDEVEFSDNDNTQILALEVPTNRQLATKLELPEEEVDDDDDDEPEVQ